MVFRTELTASFHGEGELDLPHTGPDEAWIITFTEQKGDTVDGYYAVPQQESVPFTELTPIDPESLEPTADPDPVWWAMARSTVESGTVNSAGELVLKRTDGKTMSAGKVKGEPGKDGAPGRDGKDGAPGRDGKDGAPGRDGKDGLPGRDAVLLSGDPYKYVVDETAGRVVRVWDYLNNREQMIYGNTGWRDISRFVPDYISGALLIKRENNTTWLRFENLRAADQTTTWSIWSGLIPAGFRFNESGYNYHPLAPQSASYAPGPMRTDRYGGITVYLAQGGKIMQGTVSWSTGEPWPTTLPGVAA